MTGLLDGTRTAVIGGGSLAAHTAERIGGAGGRVVVAEGLADLPADPRDELGGAVVSLQSMPAGARHAAAALDGVLGLLRNGSALRHVVVIGLEGPAASLARTLAVYATAHTADRDVRINALCVARKPDADTHRHVGDVVTALLSGLLDAVRGQTFELGARGPREVAR